MIENAGSSSSIPIGNSSTVPPGQAGLTESEAQEVVQETLITVAKKIDQLKYDPAIRTIQRLAPEHYALVDRRSV